MPLINYDQRLQVEETNPPLTRRKSFQVDSTEQFTLIVPAAVTPVSALADKAKAKAGKQETKKAEPRARRL